MFQIVDKGPQNTDSSSSSECSSTSDDDTDNESDEEDNQGHVTPDSTSFQRSPSSTYSRGMGNSPSRKSVKNDSNNGRDILAGHDVPDTDSLTVSLAKNGKSIERKISESETHDSLQELDQEDLAALLPDVPPDTSCEQTASFEASTESHTPTSSARNGYKEMDRVFPEQLVKETLAELVQMDKSITNQKCSEKSLPHGLSQKKSLQAISENTCRSVDNCISGRKYNSSMKPPEHMILKNAKGVSRNQKTTCVFTPKQSFSNQNNSDKRIIKQLSSVKIQAKKKHSLTRFSHLKKQESSTCSSLPRDGICKLKSDKMRMSMLGTEKQINIVTNSPSGDSVESAEPYVETWAPPPESLLRIDAASSVSPDSGIHDQSFAGSPLRSESPSPLHHPSHTDLEGPPVLENMKDTEPMPLLVVDESSLHAPVLTEQFRDPKLCDKSLPCSVNQISTSSLTVDYETFLSTEIAPYNKTMKRVSVQPKVKRKSWGSSPKRAGTLESKIQNYESTDKISEDKMLSSQKIGKNISKQLQNLNQISTTKIDDNIKMGKQKDFSPHKSYQSLHCSSAESMNNIERQACDNENRNHMIEAGTGIKKIVSERQLDVQQKNGKSSNKTDIKKKSNYGNQALQSKSCHVSKGHDLTSGMKIKRHKMKSTSDHLPISNNSIGDQDQNHFHSLEQKTSHEQIQNETTRPKKLCENKYTDKYSRCKSNGGKDIDNKTSVPLKKRSPGRPKGSLNKKPKLCLMRSHKCGARNLSRKKERSSNASLQCISISPSLHSSNTKNNAVDCASAVDHYQNKKIPKSANTHGKLLHNKNNLEKSSTNGSHSSVKCCRGPGRPPGSCSPPKSHHRKLPQELKQVSGESLKNIAVAVNDSGVPVDAKGHPVKRGRGRPPKQAGLPLLLPAMPPVPKCPAGLPKLIPHNTLIKRSVGRPRTRPPCLSPTRRPGRPRKHYSQREKHDLDSLMQSVKKSICSQFEDTSDDLSESATEVTSGTQSDSVSSPAHIPKDHDLCASRIRYVPKIHKPKLTVMTTKKIGLKMRSELFPQTGLPNMSRTFSALGSFMPPPVGLVSLQDGSQTASLLQHNFDDGNKFSLPFASSSSPQFHKHFTFPSPHATQSTESKSEDGSYRYRRRKKHKFKSKHKNIIDPMFMTEVERLTSDLSRLCLLDTSQSSSTNPIIKMGIFGNKDRRRQELHLSNLKRLKSHKAYELDSQSSNKIKDRGKRNRKKKIDQCDTEGENVSSREQCLPLKKRHTLIAASQVDPLALHKQTEPNMEMISVEKRRPGRPRKYPPKEIQGSSCLPRLSKKQSFKGTTDDDVHSDLTLQEITSGKSVANLPKECEENGQLIEDSIGMYQKFCYHPFLCK